jgi:hypothetical protein
MKKIYICPNAKIVNVRLKGSVLYEPGVVGGSPVTDLSLGKGNNSFDEDDEAALSSWNVWNTYDD